MEFADRLRRYRPASTAPLAGQTQTMSSSGSRAAVTGGEGVAGAAGVEAPASGAPGLPSSGLV
jgi:hypothetical protein